MIFPPSTFPYISVFINRVSAYTVIVSCCNFSFNRDFCISCSASFVTTAAFFSLKASISFAITSYSAFLYLDYVRMLPCAQEYLLQQKLSELNLSTHLFLIKFYLFCRFIRCVNGFLMQRHNDNDDNKNRNNEIQ